MRTKAPQSKKNEKPAAFDFHDYREYLQAILAYFKNSKKISTRKLAKAAGISHGYLFLVINNKRNLSAEILTKLAPHLGLKTQEIEYLKSLVDLADSKDSALKNAAFKKIKLSSKYKENFHREVETYRYLENWLNVAIRELIQTEGFKNDIQWIKSQLPGAVRAHEIEKALEFLVEKGFIQSDLQGNLSVADKDITCKGGVFQLSLGNFHQQMLQLAQSAIEKYEKHHRKQIGYTLAISQSDFEQVKSILEEAKEKIKVLESKSKKSKDTVYHVNFSAFPIAGEGVK